MLSCYLLLILQTSTYTGEVKVTDFGVSAELQSTLAMCGTFVGTFKYMSPERIRNKPYSYSSDIWSFGLVLMECATGVYPYTELTNCIEMAQTILECDVPELPSSQYTPELRDFIKQCLHRDAGKICFSNKTTYLSYRG